MMPPNSDAMIAMLRPRPIDARRRVADERRSSTVRSAPSRCAPATSSRPPASRPAVEPCRHGCGRPRVCDARWHTGRLTVSSVGRSFDADAGSLLIRTDFSDDEAWEHVVVDASRPSHPGGFTAHFVPVDDPAFEGLGATDLANVDGNANVVYAADRASMRGAERTLLVVDRLHQRGRFFRVTLAQAWSVENNLSLANMDFFEFADAAHDDGVFRGF